jgi:hypothetical protein
MLKDISSIKDKLEKAITKKGGKSKKSSSSDDETESVVTIKRESTNPWLKWTKYCKETFTEEYEAFAKERDTKQGIVPKFASYCRDDIKKDEYRDFIIALTGEEPKPKQVRKPKKSEDDSASEKPKKVTKKLAKKSDDDDEEEEEEVEEKPKAAASKKAVKKPKDEEVEKPKKAAVASKKAVKKPKDEDAEPEEKKPMALKKFKLDGTTYLRDKETNLCYTLTEENAPGDCVGIYDAASNIINPVSADDDI